MQTINLQFCDDNNLKNIPVRKTSGSVGYDIKAVSGPRIVGHSLESSLGLTWRCIDYIEYGTGIKLQPQSSNCYTLLFPRSSLSKYNLLLANSVGVIDNDYRGELLLRFKYVMQPEDLVFGIGVITAVVNQKKIYQPGDFICQLIGSESIDLEFINEDVNDTARGSGGFGHTGI